MKPLFFIVAVDVLIIIVVARFIFGSYTVFAKSLADHFFPDDVLPNPLDKFAQRHDSKHKMNILYAVILFLAGITFLIELFLLK